MLTRAVLDPVMGDNGKLYIPEDEVPEYKSLLREADLILPNQFEAECVSPFPLSSISSSVSSSVSLSFPLIYHALLLKTQIDLIAHVGPFLKHPFMTSKLSHQQSKSYIQTIVSPT